MPVEKATQPGAGRASIPRPSSTVDRHSAPFNESEAVKILAITGKDSVKRAKWLAEVLNEAANDYLVSYAINHSSVPSKQVRWNADLRRAADACLKMIAPDFSQGIPPQHSVLDVYATLFHHGPPDAIKLEHLLAFGFRDEHEALAGITNAIWLLRTFAANAEQRWRKHTASSDERARKRVRKWLLTWVSALGRCYAQTFHQLPSPTPNGPFVRFADAVRNRVLNARDGAKHTSQDAAAYAELSQFDDRRLAAFAKAHISTLRPRWKQGLESEIHLGAFQARKQS